MQHLKLILILAVTDCKHIRCHYETEVLTLAIYKFWLHGLPYLFRWPLRVEIKKLVSANCVGGYWCGLWYLLLATKVKRGKKIEQPPCVSCSKQNVLSRIPCFCLNSCPKCCHSVIQHWIAEYFPFSIMHLFPLHLFMSLMSTYFHICKACLIKYWNNYTTKANAGLCRLVQIKFPLQCSGRKYY